jgi:hypothetical protein
MEFSQIKRYTGEKTTGDEPTTESLRTRYEALRTRAAESDEAAAARHQLAERTLDLTEEYFPEEVASRRRRAAAMGFAAGMVVGGVAGTALRR